MDKNQSIKNKISAILLEGSMDNDSNKIQISIEEKLKISEDIFGELINLIAKINSKTDNAYSRALVELEKFEKKHQGTMADIEYIISESESVGVSEDRTFNALRHNYYKICNNILSCKNVIIQKNIKVIEQKLGGFETKSKSIEEKLEGIGSTILSTIVSLTVVVTAITAIDRIEAELIPLYLISMVWICMTLIIFINNLFNKSDFNSKQATFLYFVITVLELIILFPSLELIFK